MYRRMCMSIPVFHFIPPPHPLVNISLFSSSVIYRPFLIIKIAVTHGATGRSLSKPVIVQALNCVLFLATPWAAAHQAPLPSTLSWSLLKFTSIEPVTLFNHLILCCPLLLLPSVFPSIRVFSNELALYNNKTVNTSGQPTLSRHSWSLLCWLSWLHLFQLELLTSCLGGGTLQPDNSKCGLLGICEGNCWISVSFSLKKKNNYAYLWKSWSFQRKLHIQLANSIFWHYTPGT